jgi:hypothetical protein
VLIVDPILHINTIPTLQNLEERTLMLDIPKLKPCGPACGHGQMHCSPGYAETTADAAFAAFD